MKKRDFSGEEFSEGDKVEFEDKIYDFGYYSVMGRCVLYEQGEQNAQDSFTVPVSEVKFPSHLYSQAEMDALIQADAVSEAMERVKNTVDLASTERLDDIHEWEKQAQRNQSEGDMYGWNFHKGMEAGANYVNIYYFRLYREIDDILKKLPSRDGVLGKSDYEEVLADHRRLVRELDVALNGEGAAEQASLVDLLSQVKKLNQPSFRGRKWVRCPICEEPDMEALKEDDSEEEIWLVNCTNLYCASNLSEGSARNLARLKQAW